MGEFEVVKTEEEENEELREEIRKFLKELDLIMRVAETIPGQTRHFDPFLFFAWRKK